MPSQEDYESLEDLLFKPKDYREAFKNNAEGTEEGEIFEIFRKDILKYAKETPSFRDFLIKNLSDTPSTIVVKRPPTQTFSPRIRSSVMFSPRSSSRPTID